MDDPVAVVSEIVAEAQEAETHAQSAEAAATAAVLAAETVIALAASTAAVAEQQAAEEVREVTETVEETERNLEWLANELNQHKTMDAVWKTSMETNLSEIKEMVVLLTASQSLTPQNSEAVAEALGTEVVVASPESAVEAALPEVATEESPRKKRFGRL